MDVPTELLVEFAKVFGVPPVTAAVLIPLIIMLANRIARIIPDTATGPLKYIRFVAVVIGLHVKDNSGVPAVRDVNGAVVRRSTVDNIPESVEQQGILDLTADMKPDPFKRGAAAIRDQADAG